MCRLHCEFMTLKGIWSVRTTPRPAPGELKSSDKTSPCTPPACLVANHLLWKLIIFGGACLVVNPFSSIVSLTNSRPVGPAAESMIPEPYRTRNS